MHIEWDLLEHAVLANNVEAMLVIKNNARAHGTLVTWFQAMSKGPMQGKTDAEFKK